MNPASTSPIAKGIVSVMGTSVDAGGTEGKRRKAYDFYTLGVLVGRERQVRQLRSHIDALTAGHGGLLLVAGEAGIGKTRLAEEAMTLATAAGIDAHRVTCWAEAGAPPFWPWSQLLQALGAPPIDTSEQHADRELARFRLFSTISDTLQAAACAQPRVLVLDDLHWADPPSVRLLEFLAPALADTAVLVVGTYRDSEIAGPSDLASVLPDLVRHGRQLALPPLGRADLGAFVVDLAGGPVADPVLDRLHDLTAGNPLFTREVVSLLDAQGALSLPDVGALPVPESVRATLARRLDTVSPECRDVLGVASVVGVEFGLDVVSAATGRDERALLTAMEEAEAARLVCASGRGRFAFTHPLLRETAYRELGLTRRLALHEAVARALEMRAGDPAELAYHFGEATAGDASEKAVHYARAAGERAMALLAYEAAAAHFRGALEVLALGSPDPESRTAVLLQLGEALLASGDLPRARRAFEDASALSREYDRPEDLARAALGWGSGQGGIEVATFDAGQIALLREALDALGTRDPALRAWLLARLSVALSIEGTEKERQGLTDEAVAAARAAGDDLALAYALAAHCDVIAGPEHSERRLAESTEIVALTRAAGDARGELLGRRLRVLAFAELGRFADVDVEIETYARLATAIRQPLYHWYAPLWRGMRALMEGRLGDSARLCGEAETIGVAAHSDNATMLTITLRLCWLLCAGMPEVAFAHLEIMRRDWPEIEFMARPGAAMAAARAGRINEARNLLSQVDFADDFAWGAEYLPGLVMAADAAAYVGDRRMASRAYDILLPYRGMFAFDGIAAACYGSVERVLALAAAVLGRTDDASAHFDAALAAHERVGATWWAEETKRERDEFLGRRPAPASARAGAMVCEGDVWAITYEGRTVRMKQSKGLADLARLLAQPGREVHVLDLAGARGTVPAGGAGPQVDAAAREAYKRRLIELDTDIDAADRDCDAGRSETLHRERDALLAELSGAYGLGGRARRTADPAERARSAVTQRIRDALHRIDTEHPQLGAHLNRSVRTGTFCVYEPDGPVTWEISRP
jgi:hypothetical protein